MRIIETKVYLFNELNEDAKENARNWWRGIGFDYNWWDFIYNDAESIGIKISSFDLYRKEIDGEMILSAAEIAQNIFNQHGESCDTYKTAANFIELWQPIYNDYMDENGANYLCSMLEEALIELEEEFISSLLQDYLSMLNKEYEYMLSDEYVDESIIINEYEFYEDGSRA